MCILNNEVRVVAVGAGSGEWWNEDTREKRKALARTTRKRRNGVESQEEVKASLRNAIRKTPRAAWGEFLHNAEGMFGNPPIHQASTVVGGTEHLSWESPADLWEDKARTLMDISFPTPAQYEGDEGKAFESVNPNLVAAAFRGTSKKRAQVRAASARSLPDVFTIGTQTGWWLPSELTSDSGPTLPGRRPPRESRSPSRTSAITISPNHAESSPY